MRADVDQKSCGLKVRPMDRSGVPLSGVGASIVRSRLFFKYMLLFVMVVVVALVANGLFEVLFSYQEHKSSLIGIQEQQAVAAADKIEEFITQIESQVGWTTQLPWTDGTLDQVELQWDRRVALGVVMAAHGYPESPRRGDTVTGIPHEADDAVVFHAGTDRRDGALVASGGRVLNVCALGADLKQARQRAYAAIDKIDWPGGFHRTDIGWRALEREA